MHRSVLQDCSGRTVSATGQKPSGPPTEQFEAKRHFGSAPTVNRAAGDCTSPHPFNLSKAGKPWATAPLAKHLSHPTLISTSVAWSRKDARSPLLGASAGLLTLGTRANQDCILKCCSHVSTV